MTYNFSVCLFIEPFLQPLLKVIEVLVRAEEGLFREVVKHLNHVEEQVLECLAWKANSPLWDRIREAKNCVPACQEVRTIQLLVDK